MLTIDDIATELGEMAEQAEVMVEMLHDLAKSGRRAVSRLETSGHEPACRCK